MQHSQFAFVCMYIYHTLISMGSLVAHAYRNYVHVVALTHTNASAVCNVIDHAHTFHCRVYLTSKLEWVSCPHSISSIYRPTTWIFEPHAVPMRFRTCLYCIVLAWIDHCKAGVSYFRLVRPLSALKCDKLGGVGSVLSREEF